MSSVRKLPSGRFQVRWREGGKRDGREVSQTFTTLGEASQFRGLVDVAGQRYPQDWVAGRGWAKGPKDGISLGEWYVRAVEARTGANPATKATYLRYLDQYVPEFLAKKAIASITREDVGLWVGELRRRPAARGGTLSSKTIINVHGALSSVMSDAVMDGLASRNPFLGAMRGTARSRPGRTGSSSPPRSSASSMAASQSTTGTSSASCSGPGSGSARPPCCTPRPSTSTAPGCT